MALANHGFDCPFKTGIAEPYRIICVMVLQTIWSCFPAISKTWVDTRPDNARRNVGGIVGWRHRASAMSLMYLGNVTRLAEPSTPPRLERRGAGRQAPAPPVTTGALGHGSRRSGAPSSGDMPRRAPAESPQQRDDSRAPRIPGWPTLGLAAALMTQAPETVLGTPIQAPKSTGRRLRRHRQMAGTGRCCGGGTRGDAILV